MKKYRLPLSHLGWTASSLSCHFYLSISLSACQSISMSAVLSVCANKLIHFLSTIHMSPLPANTLHSKIESQRHHCSHTIYHLAHLFLPAYCTSSGSIDKEHYLTLRWFISFHILWLFDYKWIKNSTCAITKYRILFAFIYLILIKSKRQTQYWLPAIVYAGGIIVMPYGEDRGEIGMTYKRINKSMLRFHNRTNYSNSVLNHLPIKGM